MFRIGIHIFFAYSTSDQEYEDLKGDILWDCFGKGDVLPGYDANPNKIKWNAQVQPTLFSFILNASLAVVRKSEN